MRAHIPFRRTFIALGVSLALATPQQSSAAPFRGGIGRAVAEVLGLLVSMVPEQLPINVPMLITVVNPEKLASHGLTGLKANDQVKVTLLEGGKLSVVPVTKALTTQTTVTSTTGIKSATTSPTTISPILKQSLLLTVDAKGTIIGKQLVPIEPKLNLETVPLIKR